MKIILGITGSVAAILAGKIVNTFSDNEIKVVPTEKGCHFMVHSDHDMRNVWDKCVFDTQEWQWNKIGDPVLHVDLANWMDILIIAPLTANTMSKMVRGECDNLLLSIWLANPRKPVIVAPAMNTNMWNHAATKANKILLEMMGVHVIPPIDRKLACGTTGVGAMCQIDDIVKQVNLLCVP